MPRPMSAIDDYLDGLAPNQKAALARVREIVAALVPGSCSRAVAEVRVWGKRKTTCPQPR